MKISHIDIIEAVMPFTDGGASGAGIMPTRWNTTDEDENQGKVNRPVTSHHQHDDGKRRQRMQTRAGRAGQAAAANQDQGQERDICSRIVVTPCHDGKENHKQDGDDERKRDKPHVTASAAQICNSHRAWTKRQSLETSITIKVACKPKKNLTMGRIEQPGETHPCFSPPGNTSTGPHAWHALGAINSTQSAGPRGLSLTTKDNTCSLKTFS